MLNYTATRKSADRVGQIASNIWPLLLGLLMLLVPGFTNISPALAGDQPTAKANSPQMTTANDQVQGYFPQWGVYARNYHIKNLVTSGSAAKMNLLFYAFSKPDMDGSATKCFLGDPYADIDKAYDAAGSVSGVADTWDTGALRGSFNQLRQLKVLYPNLKVVISVGGWSWSDKFSAMAMTQQGRQTFVASCVDMYIKGNFAPGISYPGIFDGIDVDWEYPGVCGLTCSFHPNDAQNFVALLAEFRSQLDAAGAAAGGRHYSLHIAAPAGASAIRAQPLAQIHQYLDTIGLMAYDMHGAWDSTTNFQAPLYASPNDPSTGDIRNYNVDYAVTQYLNAGVPSEKLILGVPFYGRGWTGVTPTNNGLYQPATGAAPGTYENGVDDYHVLKNLPGFTVYRDNITKAAWLWNPTTRTFWSFDDPQVIADKMAYARQKGLGGSMFWDASGDAPNGELVTAMYNGLHAGGSATQTPTTAATATRTSTPVATNTVPANSTATNTPRPTNTVPANSTATNTPRATNTVLANSTATNTPRATNTVPAGSTATATATPCAINFSDVRDSDFFYAPVRYLYCAGIISGYTDGTFRPFANTTRAQLAKIIVGAQGWAIDTSDGPHFDDVPSSHTFYTFIETAYNHEVISGYTDGTFKPFNNVTRGQLSKIVVKAEGWSLVSPATPSFTDVATTNPFYREIETAVDHGIISGYDQPNNRREFRWSNNATRGQISKIVHSALTASKPK